MRNVWVLALVVLATGSVRAEKTPDNLLLIAGGAFKNARSVYSGKNPTVASFYLGRCEVTQREWVEIMGSNPSKFQGDSLPVETVSWYDCVEYCNARSRKEGLKPCYVIEKERKDPHNQTAIDDLKWTVTVTPGANGYRLPTEIEWEYAASGGQKSQNHVFSGGDEVDKVAWYWKNSGDTYLFGSWSWPAINRNRNKTQPVGGKSPNELGLYDMSGNVREWCWDWFGDLSEKGLAPEGSTAETGRVWKGGGWLGGDFCCASAFRASYEANGKGPDQGLRVCRDK